MSVFELPGGVMIGGMLLIIAGNTGEAWLYMCPLKPTNEKTTQP